MHAYGKMSDLEREGSSSSSLHPSGSTMPPPSKRMKQMKIQFSLSQPTDYIGTSTHSNSGQTCASDNTRNPDNCETPVNEVPSCCTSECCLGGPDLTPFQPSDSNTLTKFKKKQGDRYRNVSSTWYKTYAWLSLCTSRKKAFCCYCRYCSNNKLLGMSKKGEEHL